MNIWATIQDILSVLASLFTVFLGVRALWKPLRRWRRESRKRYREAVTEASANSHLLLSRGLEDGASALANLAYSAYLLFYIAYITSPGRQLTGPVWLQLIVIPALGLAVLLGPLLVLVGINQLLRLSNFAGAVRKELTEDE